MRTASLVLMCLSGLACTRQKETPRPPSPPPQAKAEADAGAGIELTQRCRHPAFTIAYPSGWHTNDGAVLGERCRIFHPEPITLRPNTEIGFGWAASLRIAEVPFAQVVAPTRGQEIITRRSVTVDGRSAVVIESRATDEAPQLPSGERVYQWALSVGQGRVLLATTYSVGTGDYEREKRTLDAMMETLSMHSEPSGAPVTVTRIDVTSQGHGTRVLLPVSDGGTPGWHARYVDAAHAQGSGKPIEVKGSAVLEFSVTGTGYPGDTGAEYGGPPRVTGEGLVTEVVHASVFEGQTQIVIGLEQRVPFGVHFDERQRRIVVEFSDSATRHPPQ